MKPSGKSSSVSAYDSATPSLETPKANFDAATTNGLTAPVGQSLLRVPVATTFTTSTVTQTAAVQTNSVNTANAQVSTAQVTSTSLAPPATTPNILTTVLAAFGLVATATGTPGAPAQAPLWALFAWARNEFEQGFSDLMQMAGFGSSPVATGPVDLASTTTAATNELAMTTNAMPLAAAAAAVSPAFPVPGQAMSPSTNFVNWVTGDFPVNYTLSRFGISGTDLGIMWDNGMVDNPNTPVDEHQILIAFGDTFGNLNTASQEWRSNVLMRTSDPNPADGLSVPNAALGNVFAGSPVDASQWQLGRPFSKQIIADPGLGSAVTIIPTAGIAVPTPGTQYGVTQYINFMAVQQWGAPGSWTTSYSALAYSTDNGENWTVAPQTVRYNQWWTGNQNFQQAAFVRPGDGFVYMYGTPNGRQGSAYVSRVPEASILDLSKYQYWSAGSPGFLWFPGTPAGWITGQPNAASAVMPPSGACPGVGAGNTVGELSVQYNKYLGKYVALYCDQNNSVVMRTASQPQGTWSDATVLMPQQNGGIYAPMMDPWSPSTLGTGSDLYWDLSLFSQYDVMLMHTDLTKV